MDETNETAKKNYYELLGVPADASADQIRTVYRELARVYHPDSNFYSEIIPTRVSSEQLELFKIMTAAYNTLTDPEKRAEYDEKLKAAMLNLKSWDDSQDDFWNRPSSTASHAVPRRARTRTSGFGRIDDINAEMDGQRARTKTAKIKVNPGRASSVNLVRPEADQAPPRERKNTGNPGARPARTGTEHRNLVKRRFMSPVQVIFIAVELGLMCGVALALLYY